MEKNTEETKKPAHDAAPARNLISALQADHAWFRAMVDTSPMGISIARDGITIYANDACVKMFGYSNAQEFLGTSRLNRVAPDYRWQMNLYINKRKRGEAIPNQYEFMGLRKDGSTFPVFTEVAGIRFGDETLSVAFFTDFTERKRIESALHASEKRYRTLVGTITDIITETDAKGNFLFASPQFFNLNGHEPADLVHKTPFDFMTAKDAVRCRRHFEEKAKRKEKIEGLEYTVTLKNGEIRTMETNATPYLDVNEALAGYCAVTRDITRRKEAAEAIERAEAKYRDIFENAVEGIYRSVPTGRYVDVNPAFARIFGYESPEELIEAVNDIGRQLYADPEVRRECVRIVEERGHGSFEIGIRRKDGSTGWVFNNVRAVRDAQGNTLYYEGFAEDITERKRMEEEIRKAYGELEERVRARTAELARLNETLRLDIEKRGRVEETLRLRESELEIRSRKLEDLNTTLRTLLEQREQDRVLLEERVIANINKLVMPALEKLKATPVNRQATAILGVLEANLKEIVSPFSQQLSAQSASLTQTEVQIANCIMQGMRSKEIAGLMKLSKGTIDFYRNNIRKKLGIRNQKANLQSYLLAHFKM